MEISRRSTWLGELRERCRGSIRNNLQRVKDMFPAKGITGSEFQKRERMNDPSGRNRDRRIAKKNGPYAGRIYDSAFIVAPVNVGTETCYVGALVIKDEKKQRYLLHEVRL